MDAARAVPITNLKSDWIVVVLPVVLTLEVFNFKVSAFLLGLLAALSFLRKPETGFAVELGPLLCLFASCAVVYTRPESWHLPAVFVVLGTLIVRLIRTVDARRLVLSLVEGLGLYLVVNVLAHLAGIRAPSVANQRLDRMVESGGYIRTVFPLTNSINSPSIVALAYLVSSICFLRCVGLVRRGIWLVCASAAIYVILGAGSRAALVLAAVLAIGALFFPFISRWIAQVSSVLALISAFTFPYLVNSIVGLVTPLVALAPARNTSENDISSFEGRDRIWGGVIRYWSDRVNNFSDILFGFGTSGQYKSGASSTYTSVVNGITRNPEYAFVHNSFLQQLLDGGVVGVSFLAVAVYWTSARIAKYRYQWGPFRLSAIFAITAVLLSNITEATMAPGVFQESSWLLMILIGAACQAPPCHTEDLDHSEPPVGYAADPAATIDAAGRGQRRFRKS